jgi:hypothetical protein
MKIMDCGFNPAGLFTTNFLQMQYMNTELKSGKLNGSSGVKINGNGNGHLHEVAGIG